LESPSQFPRASLATTQTRFFSSGIKKASDRLPCSLSNCTTQDFFVPPTEEQSSITTAVKTSFDQTVDLNRGVATTDESASNSSENEESGTVHRHSIQGQF